VPEPFASQTQLSQLQPAEPAHRGRSARRLRALGVNLLGSRNTALQELVSEIPTPLVAEMLGYSDQVTQKHAAEAGTTWSRYVTR
jgi:hypothetical protein